MQSDASLLPAAPFKLNLESSYTSLPAIFYSPAKPTPVPNPKLIVFNEPLAAELGIDLSDASDAELAALFSGNVLVENSTPIAQAYAGHQFGHFTTLGDGRAILLGEHLTPDGKRVDIQLKGPGPTPYSRRGDGRAALGPMLREYIVSEAMHGLGIPTTRSLAVVATGENVYRENVLPGAILTRVASSHMRVGTFEYIAAQGDLESLTALADYAIRRHYPELLTRENKYLEFFGAVADRQAQRIAQWMSVGFIHGVMNTDNMTISGETIDYGPCAFIDAYNPGTVFSSIDQQGRYAFGNQPAIASWNLARLAETLLPLFHTDDGEAIRLAKTELGKYSVAFNAYWLQIMRSKLGLITEEPGDLNLVQTWLGLLEKHRADFTNSFRALTAEKLPEEPVFQDSEFASWYALLGERHRRQAADAAHALMRKTNPVVIARNHRVEEVLAAAENGDLTVMHKLVTALQNPFADQPDNLAYRAPAPTGGEPYKTFCGT